MNTYALARAAELLRHGGLVVHATEGVWGFCCDPADQSAVARLLALKRRSWRAGLILVADSAQRFDDLLEALDAETRALVCTSWPGPVTWLVPHRDLLPRWIHGDSDLVAIRVTAHPQFHSLCAAFGGALVSTSANRSGRAPIERPEQARMQFGAGIDCVLPGALGDNSGPSTIIDARTLEIVRGDANAVPRLRAARDSRVLH